jgi:hypothetical protein
MSSLTEFIQDQFHRVHPLTAETHHFQSAPGQPPCRLHLRLEPDGSGVLIVNATNVLHLNPTAAEFAYHMVKGSPPEKAAREIARRYRTSRATAQKDYIEFRDSLLTMINRPDLDPADYMDFDRVAPHSQPLSAPLRLDCALTYRLPPGTQAEYAPTKRVDRELITSEWVTILEKAWAAGIPHVAFTGGEATLRDDLPSLIALARKIGLVTSLLSDGLKLSDPAYRHNILQTGLDHLLFILQPDLPASWDALAALMPEDLYTTVHLTVTPQNAGQAGETLQRLAKLGVKSLSLSASDVSVHALMQTLPGQASGLGMTMRWDLPVPYSGENPVAHETILDQVASGAGKAWLYVEPDGDVLPAQGEADKILGNFLRDPWEKINNSSKM